MIILGNNAEIGNDINTKIAIGKFDGIHLGHRKLINSMLEKDDGLKSLVFTFSMASTVSFATEGHMYSEEERRAIFEELGIDYLMEFVLDEETASMSPEDFVRTVLSNWLHVKKVFCGPDLSFGYKGKGNVDTIRSMYDELGIEVVVISKEKYLGEDISSTRIRKAIMDGDTDDANIMLGWK